MSDRTNQEIDVRKLVQVTTSRWKFILVLGVVLGIVALIISLLLPRQFESAAALLLTRSRSELSLASQFPTISEPVDNRLRMDALLAIVESDDVAQQTLSALEGDLPAGIDNIKSIQDTVEIFGRGDAIMIVATVEAAESAAQIANTWALFASEKINQAYSGEQPLSEITDQRVIAAEEYDVAQTEWEIFVGSNQIKVIEDQITEAETLLNAFSDDRSKLIAYHDSRVFALERYLIETEVLKKQLETGTDSTAGTLGDAIAVMGARAKSLGLLQEHMIPLIDEELGGSNATSHFTDGTRDAGVALQISDVVGLTDGSPRYADELEILIELAAQEHELSTEILGEIADGTNSGLLDPAVEETAARLRELQTQLEEEKRLEFELVRARDLSRDAYQALAQKEVEIRTNAQADQVVALASEAVVPDEPSSRGVARNAVIFGLVGLLIGVAWVFSREWWRGEI